MKLTEIIITLLSGGGIAAILPRLLPKYFDFLIKKKKQDYDTFNAQLKLVQNAHQNVQNANADVIQRLQLSIDQLSKRQIDDRKIIDELRKENAELKAEVLTLEAELKALKKENNKS
ncbi:MAG: hypothetical protein HRT61_00820 [Ekhidna sp.]|nr:hypothetical protein [Ekhidna sp.]